MAPTLVHSQEQPLSGAVAMDSIPKQNPSWQSHKHAESTDSEISFFDPSSSVASDSWSGYFDEWSSTSHDSYCPRIASTTSSPTRSHSAQQTPVCDPELLPTACPRRTRPASIRRDADTRPADRNSIKSKRYGMVPCSDPDTGTQAVTELNALLQNSLANTEDILQAMYNPDWDILSLQQWYQQSARGPSDLALFKIMFTLRYTDTDENISPVVPI